MFFFNSDSGAGFTALVDKDGSLDRLADLTSDAEDRWTHVGSDGRNLVFYSRFSQSGTATVLDGHGMPHPWPIRPIAAFGDWTGIAGNNGWFMLHNAHTGKAATGFVDVTEFGFFHFRRRFELPTDTAFTDVLAAGWSRDGGAIRDRRFLFFNRLNGSGLTYRLDDGGQVTILRKTEELPAPFSEGWTHAVAQHNEGSGRVYFYHNNTRRGSTAQVEPDGTLKRLKDGVDGFQHCTHIAEGERMLCYQRPGGMATSVEIEADGSMRRLRELGPIGDFSHIVM